MSELRFNVFGRLVAIVGTQGTWSAFFLGGDGKRLHQIIQQIPQKAGC